MTTPAIQTQDLPRKYDEVTAVNKLSLSIASGEMFAFLGHNGAGKTTTISLLTTLLLPTSGNASVMGYDIVKQNREVRQKIDYVPENLRFFGQLSQVYDIEGRIEAVLSLIEHPEWRDLQVGTFSKGMRQRIGIAQALLNYPTVLFLDEPALGLDPKGNELAAT